MMFFEPEQLDDRPIDPLTQTGKLVKKVQAIEEQIDAGNTIRYVSGINAAVATAGLVLGSTAISPLVSLLFLIGGAGAISAYCSYALYESAKLKIIPVWMPTTSGEVDQVLAEILPTSEKILWAAIDNFGAEAVEDLEKQGHLDYLLRSIKGIKVRSRETALEDFEGAIEQIGNHYFPKQSRLPKIPDTPKSVQGGNSRLGSSHNRESPPTKQPDDLNLEDNHRTSDRVATAIDQFDWSTITRRPHLFVLGDTGSGKTSLVQWLIKTHYPQSSEVLVLDPHDKKGQWGDFPTIGRGRNFDAVELALEKMVEEMDRRYGTGDYDHPPKILIIEEIPAIAANCKTAMSSIACLTLEARKVGIFLILLSQGWEVDSLGIKGKGSIRKSFLFISLGEFAIEKGKELGLSQLISQHDRPCFVGNAVAIVPELDGYTLAKSEPRDNRELLEVCLDRSTAPTQDKNLEFPLQEIVELSKSKGMVKARDIQNNIAGTKKISPTEIREIFIQLEDLEYGYCEGEGITLGFAAY